MDEVNVKLLNVFGLKHILQSRDNTIISLKGKIEYLKKSSKRDVE